MPIIRNPFRKQDENVRPVAPGVQKPNGANGANGGPVQPINIDQKVPVEYKLSEINDSGVYLPPSPTERKTFWATSSSRSTTSSTRPSLFNENEPFNISRESFDSYRRSFDISARSPVVTPDARPRISLDSRTFHPPPRSSNSFNRPLQVPGPQPVQEIGEHDEEEQSEELEEVALDDPKPQQHRKHGMFSRFVGSDSHAQRPGSQDSTATNKASWHHFGGRKRGQSGQGSELGSIPGRGSTPKPTTTTTTETLKRDGAAVVAPQISVQPPPSAPTQTANRSAPATTTENSRTPESNA